MLKDILSIGGAQELSKSHQKNINGGGKCRVLEMSSSNQTGSVSTCLVQCRPTVFGIGVDSWSEPFTIPC